MGPLPAIYIGESIIEYKVKTQSGFYSRSKSQLDTSSAKVVKSFANKLSLMKKSRFLLSHVCESF